MAKSDYRQRCLAKKGRECHFCSDTENIVVHHIDGDRKNGSIENLIPVCRACHSAIHSGAHGFEEYHQKLPDESQSHPPQEDLV